MFAKEANLPANPYFDRIVSAATGITADSRLVEQGNIFVALQGRRQNGNSFIGEALRKGAGAIVTDQSLDIYPDIPVFVVSNARRTLAHLCAWYYGFPGRKLKITAIAGTNGKTTTALMIDTILRNAGYTTGFIGTDRIQIASDSFGSSLTTPDAPTLQKCLADMVQQKVSHVSMETSAQGIELERVAAIPFHCGILTNISPDHFDFHGSFEAYVEAKKRFLELLSESSPLCAGIDDTRVAEIAGQYNGPLISFGIHNRANITADHISPLNGGCSFRMRAATPAATFEKTCTLSLIGIHNVYNALAATSACIIHQIRPEAIIDGLARFKGVERRMQIRQLGDFTVVDDTALNPGSIDAVFEAVKQLPAAGRIVLVTAIRGNRGTVINRENAAQFVKWGNFFNIERIIVSSSHSHIDSLNYVTAEEETAFLKTLSQANFSFAHFRELPDAISYALTMLKAGDLLLLLGAQGMDPAGSILDTLLHARETTNLTLETKQNHCSLPSEERP
ncbi:MAG TPA: UDP-N-acetylmuramyl-tripeptide synthetase [Negativicutes bacterium]|nr:UDP-N-acetylmuramyl-tripeptide synthetase [Negativicutes bacterium]